ncbi:hypothetical protein JXB41_08800 [Candidatus Woesearchaeota archaeon]|nr:hypothetical protein [Candidatus Woesearchaeota archaeon]
MKKRLAQIAMEYIVITGVAFMILIPGMYLFRNYVASSNDQIIEQRINLIANEILNTAREMYYVGVPSKRVIEIDMPDEIANMGVFFYDGGDGGDGDPENDEYQLIFVAETNEGRVKYYFQSDIPIKAYEDSSWFPDIGICSSFLDNDELYSYGDDHCNEDNFEPECEMGECECFPVKDYSSGKKFFKLEAAEDECYASGACVIIDEVSNELSCG